MGLESWAGLETWVGLETWPGLETWEGLQFALVADLQMLSCNKKESFKYLHAYVLEPSEPDGKQTKCTE